MARVIVTNGVGFDPLGRCGRGGRCLGRPDPYHFRPSGPAGAGDLPGCGRGERDEAGAFWAALVDQPLVRASPPWPGFIVTDDDFCTGLGSVGRVLRRQRPKPGAAQDIHRIMNLWRTLFTECVNDGIERGVLTRTET